MKTAPTDPQRATIVELLEDLDQDAALPPRLPAP